MASERDIKKQKKIDKLIKREKEACESLKEKLKNLNYHEAEKCIKQSNCSMAFKLEQFKNLKRKKKFKYNLTRILKVF